MKFTLDWLKEHLDTKASADEIGKALTMIGLEVESIESQGKALEARLPDITLRNIGKDSGGATPGEVAAEVMAALTDAASRAAASIGVGKTLEALKQNIGNINGGKLPTDAEGAKQAVDDAKKELEKAGEGLKKLFGN